MYGEQATLVVKCSDAECWWLMCATIMQSSIIVMEVSIYPINHSIYLHQSFYQSLYPIKLKFHYLPILSILFPSVYWSIIYSSLSTYLFSIYQHDLYLNLFSLHIYHLYLSTLSLSYPCLSTSLRLSIYLSIYLYISLYSISIYLSIYLYLSIMRQWDWYST